MIRKEGKRIGKGRERRRRDREPGGPQVGTKP